MIMQDGLPRIKRFLCPAEIDEQVLGFLVRLMTAFISHLGRMSASQAAGVIRTQARHRAAVIRFLAKQGWSGDWSVLGRAKKTVGGDIILGKEAKERLLALIWGGRPETAAGTWPSDFKIWPCYSLGHVTRGCSRLQQIISAQSVMAF